MIIVLMANGFEEIEALTPVDMLRRAGFDVKTVSVSGGNVIGTHGIEIKCDATPEDIDLSAVDMAIFPGGMPGATNLDASPYTDKVISAMLEKGGGLAAICAAPLVLGRRGVLSGKMATCYPGFEKELIDATIIDSSVVVDGNIVTAKGMGVALEFAEELIALLAGKEKAAEISSSICVSTKSNTDNKIPYQIPDIKLISEYDEKADSSQEEVSLLAKTLSETFDSYGISVSIEEPTVGPRVITFEVTPEKGVRVSKILNISDDITLALGRGAIRFIAPIPGKSCVVIEIPREKGTSVGLKSLIESDEFKNAASKTAVCLGRDVEGKALIADISRFPHLLVAGATGMGKSVFIHSMLASLLFKASPDDVKLILIDPKYVELHMYKDLSHLLLPIINEPKKAIATLKWATDEMERRYRLLQARAVRNLDGYNEKVAKFPALGKPMAKIVIVIDELADLTVYDRKQTEEFIARIAQKGRASGIYLIAATQRPSVNVITGVIKANIPSRVCFKVISGVDSMTVLDSRDASKLLGRGDALYASATSVMPIRMQSAYIYENDLCSLLDDVKVRNGIAIYDNEIIRLVDEAEEELSKPKRQNRSKKEYDNDEPKKNTPLIKCIPLFNDFSDEEQTFIHQEQFLEAVDLAVTTGKISTALIQRKLSIGYGKAAKFIDLMEKLGVVSEPCGQKPRDVLLTQEEWQKKLKNIQK